MILRGVYELRILDLKHSKLALRIFGPDKSDVLLSLLPLLKRDTKLQRLTEDFKSRILCVFSKFILQHFFKKYSIINTYSKSIAILLST